MNSLCRLSEGWELGAVEVNLASRDTFQREKSHDVQVELHVYMGACMSVSLYANLRGRYGGGTQVECHAAVT